MPCRTHRSHPHYSRAAIVAVALLGAGTLAGCGSDSTVDNSQATSVIPSASESAPASSTSSPAQESDSASTAPEQHRGSAAEDQGAEQVDSLPSGSGRSPEDTEFLNALKKEKIDLSRVSSAADPGGMEDQLIAAAHGFCSAQKNKKPDNFTPVAAGQLKAQGATDRDPKEVAGVIADAARSAYCR